MLVHGRHAMPFGAQGGHPLRLGPWRSHWVVPAVAIGQEAAVAEDKWVARHVLPLADAAVPEWLGALNSASKQALTRLRMPTTRAEEYRFTDLSPLYKAGLVVPPPPDESLGDLAAGLGFPECEGSCVVLVNGQLHMGLSQLSDLPAGIFVGSIKDAPADVVSQLGAQSSQRGGAFATLNGALARDVLCVVASPGASMSRPLYVAHIATSADTSLQATEAANDGSAADVARAVATPRLLVLAGQGAALEVVEEYVGSGSGAHLTAAVTEIQLGLEAVLKHCYVQREPVGATHLKTTLVAQEAGSSYTLLESCTGADVSRHDVSVVQNGPGTQTAMRHFVLCGTGQLHDVHSKLTLNHPHGKAAQLHKCIVAAPTARGVFDGNVKVNRQAQKTDAGQLSRNLLLVPRATINVKPNLQIVADDVKCTHGCAISDLSDEELFYFRARGVDADTARQALVYSFGAEVVQGLGYEQLVSRVQDDVEASLSQCNAIGVREHSRPTI